MAHLPIQSTLVPLEISYNSGVTWKPLICMQGWTLALDTASTNVDTQCGRFYGLGPVGGTFQANCVCSIDRDPTEVTYRDMLDAQVNQIALTARVQYPGAGSTGQSFYITGPVQVLNTSLVDETNNPIRFSVTLGIQGNIDNTP